MIFSLGHSTLPQEDFVAVCHEAGVQRIIDVRSHPGSGVNPQYNQKTMRRWLADNGIGYEWQGALGGWSDKHAKYAEEYAKYDVDVMAYCHNAFPKQRINRRRDDKGFTNYGFYDFQYFQTLPEYLEGISKLATRESEQLAMVCCEARFPLCHRAMLSDHLGILGIDVQHIEPRFRKIKLPRTVVKLTSHSKFLFERLMRYDEAVIDVWKKSLRSGDSR